MTFKTWSPGDVLTAADVNAYLMKQSVIVCTSGTRPSSPVTGMTIFETDTGLYQVYGGSVWTPVSSWLVTARDNTVVSAFTNSAYAAGSPTVGATFKAPPSGRVEIRWGGYLFSGSGTGIAYLSWLLSSGATPGSGSTVLAADDTRSLSVGGGGRIRAGLAEPVTGLTPGADYSVQLQHRRDNVNADVGPRWLAVWPA